MAFLRREFKQPDFRIWTTYTETTASDAAEFYFVFSVAVSIPN